MFKRKVFTATAAILLISASAASAKTRSFVINGSDLRAFVIGTAIAGSESADGVALADFDFGALTVEFVLPKDYQKNSPVSITLRMYGGGSSCVVRFFPRDIMRYRNNRAKTAGNAGSAGLTSNGPTEFTVPANFNLVHSRGYTLRKTGDGTLDTGSIRDQKAGDTIVAVFIRNAQNSADTCTDTLFIRSAKITYTVR